MDAKVQEFYNNLKKKSRAQMAKSENSKLGKWNKTEHDRFMKALQKYGKNWGLIQKVVSTRSLAQVRSHAQKLFLGMTKREIKSFESQINTRFESFCNPQKNKELKLCKKSQSRTSTGQNYSSKAIESFEENFDSGVYGKENLGFNELNPQKQFHLNGDIKTEMSLHSFRSEEIKQALDHQAENGLSRQPQFQNLLNLACSQPSQYGYYIIPQESFVWFPY